MYRMDSSSYHYQHILFPPYLHPLLRLPYFSEASPKHQIISSVVYQSVSLKNTLKA